MYGISVQLDDLHSTPASPCCQTQNRPRPLSIAGRQLRIEPEVWRQ